MSAGPDTHGPTTASRDGTPPPTSAPEVAIAPTMGTPSSTPRRTARSRASPSATPIAPRCLPPSRRNQLTVRPCRSESAAVTASLRCVITGAAGVGENNGVTRLRSVGGGEDEAGVVAAEPERVRDRRLRSDLARRARHHVELDVVAQLL